MVYDDILKIFIRNLTKLYNYLIFYYISNRLYKFKSIFKIFITIIVKQIKRKNNKL